MTSCRPAVSPLLHHSPTDSAEGSSASNASAIQHSGMLTAATVASAVVPQEFCTRKLIPAALTASTLCPHPPRHS